MARRAERRHALLRPRRRTDPGPRSAAGSAAATARRGGAATASRRPRSGFPGPLVGLFFHRHGLFRPRPVRAVVRRLYLRTMRGTATVGWVRGAFETPEERFAAGRMLLGLWLATTRQGLCLHPFGSVITNPPRTPVSPSGSRSARRRRALALLPHRPQRRAACRARAARSGSCSRERSGPAHADLRISPRGAPVRLARSSRIARGGRCSAQASSRCSGGPANGASGLRSRTRGAACPPTGRSSPSTTARGHARGLDPDLTRSRSRTRRATCSRFGVEERCRGGRLPERGAVIDESSGTSGDAEQLGARPGGTGGRPQAAAGGGSIGRRRRAAVRAQRVRARAVGDGDERHDVRRRRRDCEVGRPGHREDREARSPTSGHGYRYLICGYPPFLKTLVDRQTSTGSATRASRSPAARA